MKAFTIFSLFMGLSAIASFVQAADVDKGVGPITEAKIESTIDKAMAAKGQTLFTNKCSACHKMDERYVGPALKGISQRRSPEWAMNMILNPGEMLEQNEAAKDLLAEYLVPMTFQNVSKEEARQIFEYFRSFDANKK